MTGFWGYIAILDRLTDVTSPVVSDDMLVLGTEL